MFNSLQKIVSSLIAILSGGALFLLFKFPNRLFFLIICIVWVALLLLCEWYLRRIRQSKQTILQVLFLTISSFVSLMSIVEWNFLVWPFALFLAGVVFVLFQSIAGTDENLISIQQKPYRRIMVLILSFDAYALLATIYALSLFFMGIPFWLLTIVGGAVFGAISFMIWRMYFQLQSPQGIVWSFLIAFMMIELIWVMHFLPFGYLVSSFLVVWIWYIVQLLIRFHFNPRDIVWRKQILFLASNVILYVILMVFFARWV